MASEDQLDEIDIAAALGAEPEVSPQVLSVYIPNRDQKGLEFDPTPWIEEAETIMFRIGGGATTTPPHRGVTANEFNQPMREVTVIIYTYVTPRLLAEIPRLREFLHRFGREMKQREVGVSLSGYGETLFLRITKFDGAP